MLQKPKKHNLIFKIAILNIKTKFLFIKFLNPYLIIKTKKIKLDKIFSLIQII